MRECGKYRELLSAALDGELSPADEAVLRAHLAECPSCRNLQSILKAVSDAADPAPAGLMDAVLQKTALMPSPAVLRRRRLIRVLVPVGAAAAVAALVIGLWPTLSGRLNKGADSTFLTSGSDTVPAGDASYEAEMYLEGEDDYAASEDADGAVADGALLFYNQAPADAYDEPEAAAGLPDANIILVNGDLPEILQDAMARNTESGDLVFSDEATFFPVTYEEARALLDAGFPANFSPDLLDEDTERAGDDTAFVWVKWVP